MNHNKHQDNGESPDYRWNEELWELKNPSSLKAVDKRIEKGVHQTKENPGGIIISIKIDEMAIENIIEKAPNMVARVVAAEGTF